MPGYVAIDEEGYYYDPETGLDMIVYWDEDAYPIDQYGNRLQFLGDSGFDGGEITSAIRDVLISIWGNPAAVRANGPRDRYTGPPVYDGVRVTTTPPPDLRQREGGAGIHLSTSTLMLIVGGVLLFMLGQSRGSGGRR